MHLHNGCIPSIESYMAPCNDFSPTGSIPLSLASPRRPLIGKINFPRSSGYVDRIKVGGLDIRAESNVRLFGYTDCLSIDASKLPDDGFKSDSQASSR